MADRATSHTINIYIIAGKGDTTVPPDQTNTDVSPANSSVAGLRIDTNFLNYVWRVGWINPTFKLQRTMHISHGFRYAPWFRGCLGGVKSLATHLQDVQKIAHNLMTVSLSYGSGQANRRILHHTALLGHCDMNQ